MQSRPPDDTAPPGSPLARGLRRVGLSLPSLVSVSALLALAFVGIHVRAMVAAPPGTPVSALPADLLLALGGNWAPAVKSGEVWRLATAIFLHGGLWHLLFNVVALTQIGPTLERVFGWGRMLFFFMLTGVAASVGSMLIGRSGVGIGASGAIMGLIGMAAGWGQRSGTPVGLEVRNQMLVWAAYTLVFGFVLHADNAAHATGLVAGGAVGFAFDPKRLAQGRAGALATGLGVVGAIAAIAAIALVLTRKPSQHDELEDLVGDMDGILSVDGTFDMPEGTGSGTASGTGSTAVTEGGTGSESGTTGSESGMGTASDMGTATAGASSSAMATASGMATGTASSSAR